MAEQKQPKKDAREGEVVGESTMATSKSTPPWPAITISVFAGVVVLALIAGGWVWTSAVVHNVVTSREFSERGHSMDKNRDLRGDSVPGQRGIWGMMTPAASGVIIKIEGDTITVAGQGKQVVVKQTDSTIVSGDKSDLAVNDTVIVIGETNDDDTVAATRIVVRNQQMERGESQPRRAVPNV